MIAEPIREYNFTNLIFLSLLKKTKYEVVKSYLRVSVIKAQAPSLPSCTTHPYGRLSKLRLTGGGNSASPEFKLNGLYHDKLK